MSEQSTPPTSSMEESDDMSSTSETSMDEDLVPALVAFREEEEKERQEKEQLNKNDSEAQEKMKRLRGKVIEEIINTERTYAVDLETLVRVFVEKLQKNSKLMKKKYYEKVFSNITTLAGVSRLLVDQMEKSVLPDGSYNVGAVFLSLANELKIYTEYCINHPTATKTVELCRQQNSSFVQFEKKILESNDTKGLGILDYLIKPIQRICKYPILLKELLKYTAESRADYDDLVGALDKVEQVVKYINENKKITENQEKLSAIKNSIDGLPNFDFVNPVRYLIIEMTAFTYVRQVVATALGEIDTVENDEYKLFLFTDLLLIARLKEKGRLKYTNRIYLDKLRVTDVVGTNKHRWTFRIGRRDENSEPLVLHVSTEEEKIHFLATTKQATKEYYREHQEQLEVEAKRFLSKFEFTENPALDKRKSEKKLKNFFGDTPDPSSGHQPTSPNTSTYRKSKSSDKKSKLEQFFGSEMSHADLKNQKSGGLPTLRRQESIETSIQTSTSSPRPPTEEVSNSSSSSSEQSTLVDQQQSTSLDQQQSTSLDQQQPTSEQQTSEQGSSSPPSSSPSSPPSSESQTEESTKSKQEVSIDSPSGSETSKLSESESPKSPSAARKTNPNVVIVKPAPPRRNPSSPSSSSSASEDLVSQANGLRVLPKVDLSQVKLKPVSRRPRAPTAASTYPYAILIDKSTRPKECQPECLERYLDDAEFKDIIGVSKEIFYQFPIWKQNDLKRRNLLG